MCEEETLDWFVKKKPLFWPSLHLHSDRAKKNHTQFVKIKKNHWQTSLKLEILILCRERRLSLTDFQSFCDLVAESLAKKKSLCQSKRHPTPVPVLSNVSCFNPSWHTKMSEFILLSWHGFFSQEGLFVRQNWCHRKQNPEYGNVLPENLPCASGKFILATLSSTPSLLSAKMGFSLRRFFLSSYLDVSPSRLVPDVVRGAHLGAGLPLQLLRLDPLLAAAWTKKNPQ